jgi:thioredoxin 1
MLDELAGEYGEKLQIAKINVDECPTLASQFGVMSIPTLILFKNGKLASQRVGGSTKAALKAFIDGIL